jgi:hypothetical protein
MEFDLTQKILDLKGEPLVQDATPFIECPKCGHRVAGPEMTLADLIYNALTIVLSSNNPAPASKLRMIKLAQKIIDTDKIDLGAKDISLIMDRVNVIYNSQLLYYRANEILQAGEGGDE